MVCEIHLHLASEVTFLFSGCLRDEAQAECCSHLGLRSQRLQFKPERATESMKLKN